MKLNTPRWWYSRDTRHAPISRAALKPLSWIWADVTARKIAKTQGFDAQIPVISVGNLTMGGSGKTPVAREILRLLRQQGHAPSALSRGYGGTLSGPVIVDPQHHTAQEVGDEPLMLAQDGMVVVSRDRIEGAKTARQAGATHLVLDDGHQNPSLKKDLALIVVDGETRNDEWTFGDGSVFPSGPMREPLKAGLARADGVIVLLPTDMTEADPELLALFGNLPVFTARLVAPHAPPSGPQVGFAGIAKPWKVERSLIAAGCDLKDFVPYPDHAALTDSDIDFLKQRAELFEAGLVTTEKDWIRLSDSQRENIKAWPVCANFDDENHFTDWLNRTFGATLN